MRGLSSGLWPAEPPFARQGSRVLQALVVHLPRVERGPGGQRGVGRLGQLAPLPSCLQRGSFRGVFAE